MASASPNSQSNDSSAQPHAQLNLFDCVCVIVGVIIGSGIYKTSPLIARMTRGVTQSLLDSPTFASWPAAQDWLPTAVLIGAWLLGAAIVITGALCYAELATAYPHHGGDYFYLKRAFGPGAGFFFVWCVFWIVRPANVGAMGFVFSEYFLRSVPLETWLPGLPKSALSLGVTLFVLLLLTVLNLLGVRGGIRTQNVLSVTKMAGLLLVFIVAFAMPPRAGFEPLAFVGADAGDSFGLAFVLIMFTFGGWNDLAFVSVEVKNPRRNMLRALLIGVACVTGIYLLVTLAFVHGMGFGGLVQANEVASDLLESRIGDMGSRLISALICVSTLGAINGMLYAGARIYFALGQEHRTFRWVGKWNSRFGGPARGLWVQAVITAGLILGFGLYQDGFTRLVNFSTLFFWSFFLLVGIALFRLRALEPDHPRPYRVLGYPVTPLLFCLSSLYVLHSSTMYALSVGGWEWAWGLLLVYFGLLIAQINPDQGGKPLPSRFHFVAWAARVLTLLAFAGTLLALASPMGWASELAVSFPLQYATVAMVATALFLLCRRRIASAVAMAVLVLNVGWLWMGQQPVIVTDTRIMNESSDSNDETLSVVSINVWRGNRNYDEIVGLIRQRKADIVLLLEIGPEWEAHFRELRDEYRFQEIVPRDHAFGMAVLSRLPMATRIENLSGGDFPQILVDVSRPNLGRLLIAATHTMAPVTSVMTQARDQQLQEWSEELLRHESPGVMVGDFNITPYSRVFRRLLADGRLHDSRLDFGLQPTWPQSLADFGIPIDHALVTPSVRVLGRETFPIPGSDHRGIWLELQVESPR